MKDGYELIKEYSDKLESLVEALKNEVDQIEYIAVIDYKDENKYRTKILCNCDYYEKQCKYQTLIELNKDMILSETIANAIGEYVSKALGKELKHLVFTEQIGIVEV